jgi:predicted DNA binding CopG/RHH family protein
MPTEAQLEADVLAAYESGKLKSAATKGELARLRAAARATAIKDRRVNIRLSTGDLQDIQARALQEGMPYQTLIASVLHKYVTGRLTEPPAAQRDRAAQVRARVAAVGGGDLVPEPRESVRPAPDLSDPPSRRRAARVKPSAARG